MALKTCVGVGKGGRERERESGGVREREEQTEGTQSPSLMSLGFHVIILNSGWYKEQYIILIVFRMIY